MPYASRCQQAVLDDLKGTLLICVHPLSVIFLACMANSLFLVCICFLWAQSNSCCSQQKFPIGAIRPQCLFHVFGFLKKKKSPTTTKPHPARVMNLYCVWMYKQLNQICPLIFLVYLNLCLSFKIIRKTNMCLFSYRRVKIFGREETYSSS